MEINTNFNKNYRKWFLKDLTRAIDKYRMIDKGERVAVALSGGKDSMSLLLMLTLLKNYSHLSFDLSAIHIKISDYDTQCLQELCEALQIPYFEEILRVEQPPASKSVCYTCARLKRGAISHALKQRGIRKVAYGHHADDAAETLIMNLIQNQKLGSFSPRVEVPESDLVIIRPMIYLEEETIRKIHRYFKLPLLEYDCPHADDNLRSLVKNGVSQLDRLFHTKGFSRKTVAALENIDPANIWSDIAKQEDQD